MQTDPLLNCPFCAQEGCELVEHPDVVVEGVVVSSTFYIKCNWCNTRGPTSRDAYRATGTWNYVSRVVKKDRGIS